MKIEDLINTQSKGAKEARLEEQVSVDRTAKRYGVEREDIRDAIAEIESAHTIEISATKRKEELQQYLRRVYDDLAKSWSFTNMAHMMATAHTEIVARAIADPRAFGKEGIRALKDVSQLLYPTEKLSIKRRLPDGDTPSDLLNRIRRRLVESGEVIDAEPISATVSEAPEAVASEQVLESQSPERDDELPAPALESEELGQ